MKRRSFFNAAAISVLGASLLSNKAVSQSTGKVDARLKELNIDVKAAEAPVAAYVGWRKVGNMVYIAGQVPAGPDGLVLGKLGENMTTDEGYAYPDRSGG